MNFDFEAILFYATLFTGIVTLLDVIFWAPMRSRKYKKMSKRAVTIPSEKMPIIIDYCRSFFPILLIVFLLRSFLVEPFRIPSGSLEPTLLTGDFIVVNKFDYGIRLPMLHKKIYGQGEPERGDIVIFRWPPNPQYYFIKRLIGLPGDHISYINKVLYINGKKVPQNFIESTINKDGGRPVILLEENLLGVTHQIYQDPMRTATDFTDIIVPNSMYFVMGDNRDDSADSRVFGFVPDKNLIGKAIYIWMSWDSEDFAVRWRRLANKIS